MEPVKLEGSEDINYPCPIGDLESKVMMGIDLPEKIQELRLGRGVFSGTPILQTPRKGVDKDALDFAFKTPSRTAHLDPDTPHFPGHFSASKGRATRGRYEDMELAHERQKSKLLSLIRTIVPEPMPEEKVEVVVDLIQVAVSLDEVERILVALHSEFPLITLLTRVSNITHITHREGESRFDDDMAVELKGQGDDTGAVAELRGRIIHHRNVENDFQRQTNSPHSITSYSVSPASSRRATSTVSRVDTNASHATSAISQAAHNVASAASEIGLAAEEARSRRDSLAPSDIDIGYAASEVISSHGAACGVRHNIDPSTDTLGHSEPQTGPDPITTFGQSAPAQALSDSDKPGTIDSNSPPNEEESRKISVFTPANQARSDNGVSVHADEGQTGLDKPKQVPLLSVTWDQGVVTNSSFSGDMFWTTSSSDSPLSLENLSLGAKAVPGHIHIHNNTSSPEVPEAFLLEEQIDKQDCRTWTWRNITSVFTPEEIVQPPFVVHPLYPDNALKLDEDYIPRYVLLIGLKQKWRLSQRPPPPAPKRSSARKRTY